MNSLHGFINTCLILLLFIFTPIAAYATECHLGTDCQLVGSDFVYFIIQPSDGTQYLCSLRSTEDNKHIEVIIMPGKDFYFEGRNLAAGTSVNTVEIQGKFIHQPSMEGQIIMKNITSTKGIADCMPD